MLSTFSKSLLNGGFRNTKPIKGMFILLNKERKSLTKPYKILVFVHSCFHASKQQSVIGILYILEYIFHADVRETPENTFFAKNDPFFAFFSFCFSPMSLSLEFAIQWKKPHRNRSTISRAIKGHTHIHTYISALLRCIDWLCKKTLLKYTATSLTIQTFTKKIRSLKTQKKKKTFEKLKVKHNYYI